MFGADFNEPRAPWQCTCSMQWNMSEFLDGDLQCVSRIRPVNRLVRSAPQAFYVGNGQAAVGSLCILALRAAASCSGSSLRHVGRFAAYASSSERSQRVLRGPSERDAGKSGSLHRLRKRRREMPSKVADRRASSRIGNAMMSECTSGHVAAQ
jgi:hypothetical protein